MTQELTFSPATANDIDALVQLVNSAYRGESSRKGWTTEADFLDGIRTDAVQMAPMIREPGSTIIKCTDQEGRLLGCVYLQRQDSSLYLGMLTVSPDTQARGIGKQLMSYAEQFARAEGCIKIVMTVITIRHELISWYQRRGYALTPEIKPFPNDPRFGIPRQPLEFVVMEKKLL